MFPQKHIPGSWALFSSAFSTTDPPPFCSTETKSGTGAPVEATQVWAEWEDEVVGPAKLFSYYMSQKDTCLPCYNVTKPHYYPPQCHFLQNCCLSYSCTSSLHKLGSHWAQALRRCPSVALGFWAGLLQTCYSRGAASSPTQISLHTSSHITGTSLFPAKMTFPPGQPIPSAAVPLVPSRPHIAHPPGRAGRSWHGGDACVVWQTH